MDVRLRIMSALLCVAVPPVGQAVAQGMSANMPAEPATKAQVAVAHQIDRYIASINSGDVEAAKMLWNDSDDITFINTSGIHKAWPAINRTVHSSFRDKFITRDLRLVASPAIQVFGNTVIVEFMWDFDGVMTNGKELHTRGGRESQVYVRTSRRDWRLVHAHYSLQPPLVTPQS